MNHVQWCEQVWESVISVYKSDPSTAQHNGVSVIGVAQHIVGEEKISRETEDAVRAAMEELKAHRVLESPRIITSSRDWYMMTRAGLDFPSYRDTLHSHIKFIKTSQIGLQMLICIADQTQNMQVDRANQVLIDTEDIQGYTGVHDLAVIDFELNQLHNDKLIAATKTLNAQNPWVNIRITYAGLIQLNRA